MNDTPPLAGAYDTIKVFMTLVDGDAFFAKMFVPHGERLQDLMNDRRKFIPVERHMSNRGRGNEDVWIMTVINKESIRSIEER